MFRRKPALSRIPSQSSIATTATILSNNGMSFFDNDGTSKDGADSLQVTGRGRGNKKFRERLRRYLSSIGSEKINGSPYDVLLLDELGRCNYQTKDGKFDIQITQDEKSLSISTCVYSCSSDVTSISVMKRALELNHNARGDRHGFSLGIDPGLPDGSFTMPMILGITRSMARMKRSDVMFTLTNFIEIANNIRSKLEDADDGRLGMAPAPLFRLRTPTYQQLKPSSFKSLASIPPDPPSQTAIAHPVSQRHQQKVKKKKAVQSRQHHGHRRTSTIRAVRVTSFSREKSFEKTSATTTMGLQFSNFERGSGGSRHSRDETRKAKEAFQKKWRDARRMSMLATPPSTQLQRPVRVASMEPPPSPKPWGDGMDKTPIISNKKIVKHRVSFQVTPAVMGEQSKDRGSVEEPGSHIMTGASIVANDRSIYHGQSHIIQNEKTTSPEHLFWI